MANKNKIEHYQIVFYLGGDCYTDFSETSNVTLRSKTIEGLAKKLKYIKDFRKNIFDTYVYKCVEGKLVILLGLSTIEHLENWFKRKGIDL